MANSHAKCNGNTRTLCKYDCPKCYELSFASSPKVSFWSDSNIKTPRQVFKSARGVYKFNCIDCKTVFEISLTKVTQGLWCSHCKGGNLCSSEDCMMCFNRSFASNPKSVCWSDENKLSARQVSKNSNLKWKFDCEKCFHPFELKLVDCTQRGNWCPYCSSKKLCDDEECTFCFDKSFASSPKAKFWSEENKTVPRKVFKSSHVRYIFDCDICEHSFDIRLDDAFKRDTWCQYCKGGLLCENKNCNFCFDKSFASHPQAEFWSKNNTVSPRDVRQSVQKKYWFDCQKCNHSFEGMLGNIVHNDSWCPYCSSPPKSLCNLDECDHCFNNSAASHPKAKFWSPLNKCSPRDVFKNTHTKYIYICDECEFPFETTPNHIVAGNWCPLCKNKTEKKLYFWLLAEYPDYTITKPGKQKFVWCQNPETGRPLFFDFYIPELGLIIELDGPQHFKQIHNWEPPEEVQARDRYKENSIITHGLSMIRLLQEDVLRDHNNWEPNLREVLQLSEKVESRDTSPMEIFVSSIYEDHIISTSYQEN